MANCNVISHRGANQVAPQNTIEAFKKSIEIGYHFDMIRILRVFLRKNDKPFEMIFFAKTRFKMTRKLLSF